MLGFLGGLLNTLWQSAVAVGDFFTSAFAGLVAAGQQALASIVQEVAIMARATSDALQGLTAWTQTQVARLSQDVNNFTNEISQVIHVTPERTRQYMLGRLRASPMGVMSEGLTVLQQSGGAPSHPDPNPGAPWAVAEGIRAELAMLHADPRHSLRVVLEEIRTDVAAWRAGRPSELPPFPRDPSEIPDYRPPAPVGGSDPNASGLLMPGDQVFIEQTTRGAAAP